MKIISWNLNGIRASLKTGLSDFIQEDLADVYCFQETKVDETAIPQLEASLFDVLQEFMLYHHSATSRKGYSGVMTLTKEKPLSVSQGIGIEEFDREGRVLTLEFPDFYLVNTYFPNSGRDLERMAYKLKFNLALQHFVQRLHPGGVHSRGVKEKGVLIVGDFNVAHEEIDIARPKANRKNAGFTDEERGWMTQFLADGYLDAFRLFDQTGNNYTWWSYMHNAREKNIGWRIDLAVVSQNLKDTVISCQHLTEVYGSDHCPVLVEIE